MKKILLGAAAAVIVIAMTGGAFAASVAPTVGVTAGVASKCVTNGNGALAITIDSSESGQLNMTPTQPQVKFTKGDTVGIVASNTEGDSTGTPGTITGLLKLAGHASIPYTVTFTSGPTGNGFGAAADLGINIAGYVAQADA